MNRSTPNGPPAFWKRLPTNIWMVYLLWLVSLGLFIADFFLGRILVVTLTQLTGLGYWQVSFFDRLGILLVGLAAAVLTIYVEHWYRTGAEKGLLWPRFFRITAWQLAVIAAGMLAAPFAPG